MLSGSSAAAQQCLRLFLSAHVCMPEQDAADPVWWVSTDIVSMLLYWKSTLAAMAYSLHSAGDWHCHECRAAKKAAVKAAKPATSTEAVVSEPDDEAKTTAKPTRRSADLLRPPF